MRRLLILCVVLALTACGDRSGAPQAASQRASDITKAQVGSAKLPPGFTATVHGYDAKGCKDKAKAQAVIAASKAGDTTKVIQLIADGMKDQSCRGFGDGLPIAIDQKEGSLSCIRPADDPDNKQCFWVDTSTL